MTGELQYAVTELIDEVDSPEETFAHAAQLSLHTLSGDHATDTICLLGQISFEPDGILVEGVL